MRLVTSAVVISMFLVPICALASNEGIGDYVDGLDHLEAADWNGAQASFSRAIDADEENSDYYIARGVARALGEKPADAEKDLTRALKLDPGNDEARLWLATVVAMQGDFMRDSTIYPAAVFKDEYVNAVRDMSRKYGQAAWVEQRISRNSRRSRPRDDEEPPPSTGNPELDRQIREAYEADRRSEQEHDQRRADEDTRKREEVRATFPMLAQMFVARVKANSPQLASTLLERVKQRYEGKEFAAAARDLQRLLSASPEDATLLSMNAGCMLALNAPAVARREYTHALTLKPDAADGYFGRALAAARMGDPLRANSDVEIAAALRPADLERYRGQLKAELARHPITAVPKEQFPGMLSDLQKAAMGDVNWEDLVTRANNFVKVANQHRLYADEAYQDELRQLEESLAKLSNKPDQLANLGEFLYREASKVRGETVGPRDEFQPYRWTSKESQAREYARAERLLDEALQQSPDHLKATTFKAACLIHRLKWYEAEMLLRKALKIAPNDPQVLRLFAQTLDHAADVRAANAARLRAVETWEDWLYIYTRYPSQAELEQAEQYDRQAEALWKWAMENLEAAANARRGTPEGYYYEAVLARRKGDPNSAIAAFRKAIEGDPQHMDARDELIAVLARTGQTEEALREQATTSNLLHTTAGPLLRLTWMQFPKTKFKSARQALERAAELDPTDPRVPAYNGVLALAQDKQDEALGWFRAAAAINEAKARMSGLSITGSDRPCTPDEIALAVALNLRIGDLLLNMKRHAEAAEAYQRNIALEPRIQMTKRYDRVPGAMLPDPQTDPTTIPETQALATLMAWSQAGTARAMMAMKKLDEAAQAARATVAYEENKPPTVDAGSSLLEPSAWGRLMLIRITLQKGSVGEAHDMMKVTAILWNAGESLKAEHRALEEAIAQARKNDPESPDRQWERQREQRLRELEERRAEQQRQREERRRSGGGGTRGPG